MLAALFCYLMLWIVNLIFYRLGIHQTVTRARLSLYDHFTNTTSLSSSVVEARRL